jgi:propionyl-CoA carboxylase alpha chain
MAGPSKAVMYAEDPYRNFLPSIGRLVRYRPPEEMASGDGLTIRNDTGVVEGSEISMFYDPMIAKLITHAPTREEAIDAMSSALDAFYVDGIQHNVPFLTALMNHPRWRPENWRPASSPTNIRTAFSRLSRTTKPIRCLAAVSLSMGALNANGLTICPAACGRIPGRSARTGWSSSTRPMCPSVLRPAIRERRLSLMSRSATALCDRGIRLGAGRPALVAARVGKRTVTVQVRRSRGGYRLDWQGYSVIAKVMTPRVAELDGLMPEKLPPDTSKMLLCPMPGLVVSIAVSVKGRKSRRANSWPSLKP